MRNPEAALREDVVDRFRHHFAGRALDVVFAVPPVAAHVAGRAVNTAAVTLRTFIQRILGR